MKNEMAGLHCFVTNQGVYDMKQAMLFAIALFATVSANAATLTINPTGSTNATQTTSVDTGSTVLGSGTVTNGDEPWSSTYDVTTTEDTSTIIEWSFNPVAALTEATISFDNGVDPVQLFDISGDFRFTGLIYAGTVASVNLLNGNRNVFKYDVSLQSVSEVPVPAAFFLLAPALLGFLGLRRKNVL
jgi:hypothetical protein|tara:strand:+ start:1739 stop:2299 length:561 start_codon:yes stop_codon:yes gene_type:complete